MECSQVEELLSEYVDGALDASAREEMERHLAACPRCGAELTDFNRYRQAMRNASAVRPPVDFLAKVQQRIEAESRWRRFFNKVIVPMRTSLPLEFAGVLVTALLLLVVFYQHTLVPKRSALHSDSGSSETSTSPAVSAPGETPSAKLKQKAVDAPSILVPAKTLGKTAHIRLTLFLQTSQGAAAAAASVAENDAVPALPPAEEAGRAGPMVQQRRAERMPAALSPLPANGARRQNKDAAPPPAALPEQPMPLGAAGVPSDVLAAIKDQVAQLKGNVLATEGPPANGLPLSVTIQIPAEKYPFLLDFLQRLGRFQPLPSALSEAGTAGAEKLQIELTITR